MKPCIKSVISCLYKNRGRGKLGMLRMFSKSVLKEYMEAASTTKLSSAETQ